MIAPAHFLDRQSFESLIRTLVRDDSGGCFGRIHIVSIQAITDHNLDRMLSKAVTIAETILRARLGPTDACLPLSTGQFMLVFPGLNEAEGAVRAAAIALEIKEHLVGSDAGGLQVSSEVLPLRVLKEALPNVETMRAAIEVGTSRGGIQLSVSHQPVWDCVSGRIVGSRARIRRDFCGQVMYEARAMFGGEHDAIAVDVNDRLAGAGGAFPLGRGELFLPVALNEHTLGPPGGLHSFLRRAIRPGGPRIVVELAGAVASLSRPALRSVVADIRSRGARVAVRNLPSAEDARFLHHCGVEFLCLNESEVRSAGLSTSTLYALFTVVAREMERLGFTLCLWNAATPDEVKRAAGLGFTLFSGTPIGPTTESPTLPRELATDAVFA